MLGCAAGSNVRQRFVRKCNPPVVANGAYRCPPDTAGNAEEKEEDCATTSPACYDNYRGICGCSKEGNSPHSIGDGTTQGSCASNQVCNSDGQCRDRGIFFTKNLYLFQSNNKMVTLFILVLRVILIIRPNIFR